MPASSSHLCGRGPGNSREDRSPAGRGAEGQGAAAAWGKAAPGRVTEGAIWTLTEAFPFHKHTVVLKQWLSPQTHAWA